MDHWDTFTGLLTEVKENLRTVEQVFSAAELFTTQEEGTMSLDEGFDVVDEYQLPSLVEVKEDRTLLPTAQDVLVRVDKASTRLGRPSEKGNPSSGTVRALNLQVRLVEGIEVPGENGEVTTKYVNKVDFVEIEYQVVKPEARQEERYTGKNQAFLVPLKQLLTAFGYDLDTPPAINDGFLSELAGKTFRLNIGKRPINVLDPETGKWEATGEYRNSFRNFKPA